MPAFKHNPPKYTYFLSICLIFIGSISMGYSYLMHPTLVPIYGGGEQFYLEDYNNYTTQFPFYTNTRLSIIMNANETVQISINSEIVFTGTYYEVEIDSTTRNDCIYGCFFSWVFPSGYLINKYELVLLQKENR